MLNLRNNRNNSFKNRWQNIVAGMVIAATATIGATGVNAQTVPVIAPTGFTQLDPNTNIGGTFVQLEAGNATDDQILWAIGQTGNSGFYFLTDTSPAGATFIGNLSPATAEATIDWTAGSTLTAGAAGTNVGIGVMGTGQLGKTINIGSYTVEQNDTTVTNNTLGFAFQSNQSDPSNGNGAWLGTLNAGNITVDAAGGNTVGLGFLENTGIAGVDINGNVTTGNITVTGDSATPVFGLYGGNIGSGTTVSSGTVGTNVTVTLGNVTVLNTGNQGSNVQNAASGVGVNSIQAGSTLSVGAISVTSDNGEAFGVHFYGDNDIASGGTLALTGNIDVSGENWTAGITGGNAGGTLTINGGGNTVKATSTSGEAVGIRGAQDPVPVGSAEALALTLADDLTIDVTGNADSRAIQLRTQGSALNIASGKTLTTLNDGGVVVFGTISGGGDVNLNGLLTTNGTTGTGVANTTLGAITLGDITTTGGVSTDFGSITASSINVTGIGNVSTYYAIPTNDNLYADVTVTGNVSVADGSIYAKVLTVGGNLTQGYSLANHGNVNDPSHDAVLGADGINVTGSINASGRVLANGAADANASISAGSINTQAYVLANGNITTTVGGIVANGTNTTLGNGGGAQIQSLNGSITSAGNITAVNGEVLAATNITATGDITAGAGRVEATAGNISAADITANQIIAGGDITANDVTAGDVTVGSGAISGKLTVSGNLDATTGALTLADVSTIGGTLHSKGNFANSGNVTVTGAATLDTDAAFNANFTANGISVTGNATVGGTNTTVTSSDNVTVTGSYTDTATSTLALTGTGAANRNVSVGYGTINGKLTGVANLTATGADTTTLTLNTAADPSITGNLNVEKGSLVVSNAFTAGGTATVSNGAAFNANFGAAGISVTGNATAGANTTVTSSDNVTVTGSYTDTATSTLALTGTNKDVSVGSGTINGKLTDVADLTSGGNLTLNAASSNGTDPASISGNLKAGGSLQNNSAFVVGGTATVAGNATINANFTATNTNSEATAIDLKGGTTVTNATVAATTGNIATKNLSLVGTGAIQTGAGNLTVTGTYTDTATSTLNVTGKVTINSAAATTINSIVNNNVVDLTSTGDLVLDGADNKAISGNLTAQGAFENQKAFTAGGTATVGNGAAFNANFGAAGISVTGNATAGAGVTVTSSDNVTVTGSYTDTATSTLALTGTDAANRNVSVGSGTINGTLNGANNLIATDANNKLTLDTTANSISGSLNAAGQFENNAAFTAVGTATVAGTADFNASLTAGTIEVKGTTATVTGQNTVLESTVGGITIDNALVLKDKATILLTGGDLTVSGTYTDATGTTIDGNNYQGGININGGSTINADLEKVKGLGITGDLTLNSNSADINYLYVDGNYTQTGNLTVGDGVPAPPADTATPNYTVVVTGEANISGSITANNNTAGAGGAAVDKGIKIGYGTISGKLTGVSDLTATNANQTLTLNTTANSISGSLNAAGQFENNAAFEADGMAMVGGNATINANFTADGIIVDKNATVGGANTTVTSSDNVTVTGSYTDTATSTLALTGTGAANRNVSVGYGTISGKLIGANDLTATDAAQTLTLNTTDKSISGSLNAAGGFQNDATFTAAGTATIGQNATFNANFTAQSITANGANTTVAVGAGAIATATRGNIDTFHLILGGNSEINGAGNLGVAGNYSDQSTSRVAVAGAFNYTGTNAPLVVNSTNFSAGSINTNGESLTLNDNANVTATNGNITTDSLTLGNASSITASNPSDSPDTGNLTVTGTYLDQSTSVVNVAGVFGYTGNQTINSTCFTAGTVDVTAGQTLTLSSGAKVIAANSTNNGTLVLGDGSKFGKTGKTLINNGIISVQEGGRSTIKSTVAGTGGQILIGKGDSTDSDGAGLDVKGDWKSSGRNLDFFVDYQGKVGTIVIDGTATKSGAADSVYLKEQDGFETNRNKLGQTVSQEEHNLITATRAGSVDDAFQFAGGNTNSWKFFLNPIQSKDDETKTVWQLSAESEAVVPDVSSFFLTNIIGFDLPRAQNVNGPWVRYKGGAVSDDQAQIDSTTYQMFQVGWDKRFDAVYGGNWYAGIFMEGDWMYGRGDYRRDRDKDQKGWKAGTLKSEHRGVGAGLYVSRGFENDWYIDVLGRINSFASSVDMTSDNKKITSDYSGKWTDSIFSFAIEIGKTFDSKNKRWSFNPYNRFLYNSSPGANYLLQITGDVKEDYQTLQVHSHAADAWTNQLGGRLYWNSKWRGQDLGNIFVGADYYQGLTGRFGVDMKAVENDKWIKSELTRSKNNLSYGVSTIGMSMFPTDRISLSVQTDLMFGEVSGWSATVGGRYSY